MIAALDISFNIPPSCHSPLNPIYILADKNMLAVRLFDHSDEQFQGLENAYFCFVLFFFFFLSSKQ